MEDESQTKRTVDWLLEQVDLIRSEYGYTDEYIIEKSFQWLNSCYELIVRRKHDDRVALASMITMGVAQMFSSDSKNRLKTYDQLIAENEDRYGNHDDDYVNEKFGGGFGFSNDMS